MSAVPAGYKQTEAGVIPQEWECRELVTEISEMTDFVAAGSFESLRNNVRVFDVPKFALYVRLYDLRLGLGHDTQKYVDKDSYKFLEKSNLFGNELLVANIGANVGETFLMPENLGAATIAPNMIVVRSNPKKVQYDFLYHFTASNFGQARMRDLIAGSGHPKINKTDLKKLKVLVPPLPEQRAIAAALSDVDALLAKLDQFIAKKRDLKQAAMQQLLTGQTRLPGFGAKHSYKKTEIGAIPEDWEVRPLLTAVRIAQGQADPKIEPYKSMVLVGPAHVESGTGKLIARQTAAEQGAISGKYLFSAGDIVYGKINPYLQKAFLADSSGLCSADMYPLKPTNDVVSGFMLAVILGRRFTKYAESVSVRSGMPKINRDEMGRFSFPLPSDKTEQTAIASVLSDMDAEIAALEARRDKTRALKQGMMQELLTGRIRLV
ncbi:MAG: restriction endonuclease subunit S [Bacteroidetes bacterium]|nr:restriction endonuclease subunit S [Bacteroidota bacterium]